MPWMLFPVEQTGQMNPPKKLGMRGTAAFLLAFSLLFFSSAAQAGNIEVTPILGYTFGGGLENTRTGDSLDLAEGESFGIVLGLHDKSRAGSVYELFYSHQETYIKGDGTTFSSDPRLALAIDYFHLGGTYGKEGEQFNPFVSGGLGVTHMSPERGDSETRFSLSLGGGLKVPLTERIGLRFEGRGFGTLFNGSGSFFCVNSNCAIQVKGNMLWQFTAFTGVVFNF